MNKYITPPTLTVIAFV